MAPYRPRLASRGDLATYFGPLEVRVLEAPWSRDTEASVRDVQVLFPNTAYTTLMTTLDRLHRKGVLTRVKSGRAYLYRPRCTRDELVSELAVTTFGALLHPRATAVHPIMSCFVEAVSRRDRALLDDLERLVQAKRAEEDAGT
jgi:predicted transcriptional regulator